MARAVVGDVLRRLAGEENIGLALHQVVTDDQEQRGCSDMSVRRRLGIYWPTKFILEASLTSVRRDVWSQSRVWWNAGERASGKRPAVPTRATTQSMEPPR